MVRRFYGLPSLNALASFEAAARHLSLTKAAEEMHVTPGALSKQVKLLEEDLGGPLFVRRHRALELTARGETLAGALREGFERVSATFRQLKSVGGQSSVTLGSTMAVAHLWLMPRMGAFWAAHQDIVVDHVISDHPHGLDRPDIDLRIRYGEGDWPGEEAVKLHGDRILPVASPAFAQRHADCGLDGLVKLQLLSVEGGDWDWTTWADFLRETGTAHGHLNVRRFNSHVIALQAAREGQGVVLGWASLVEPLIRAGDLVRLTDAEIVAPDSFYVSWSTQRSLGSPAETLRDWLLALV